MKKLFLTLFVLLFSLNADVKYSAVIDQQIEIVSKINESNVTEENIKSFASQQAKIYDIFLDELMINKSKYINDAELYTYEIFSLEKSIALNKRASNAHAVIRDEVQLKSYKVVRNQNILIKNILISLDATELMSFEESVNKYVLQNKEALSDIYTYDYRDVLSQDSNSELLVQAKENIREFYTLEEINADFLNNIYKFEKKMYRLNKYTNYNLIRVVISINNFEVVQSLNATLHGYGLSVIKIIIIFLLFLVIYIFRKIIYVALESYILQLEYLNKYSQEILKKLHKPIQMTVILININITIYVYNDFSSVEYISKLFNVIYSFIFTFITYRVVNAISTIKISEISKVEKEIKNELINVGIKIMNFIIIIIGLLVTLHFSGVNLTAVLSGLGIGGLAVAFAAKDTISNFFGTLSVLFSNVFSQGDWIVVDGNEGVVVEIGLRVTTIRTFDNALIAIPNGTFASKEVKNWNKRALGRRIKMSIGVKYDSKREDIKNCVSEIREMLDEHPAIATENTKHQHKQRREKLVSQDDLEGVKKTLLVYLEEFGPSSINILIYCFSKSVVWAEWLEVKEDIMLKIMEILERNSLEFAFPSLSIYNENEKP